MKRTILLILSSLMLLSCLKDLGNYEYHELMEPEISGLDERIVLKEDRHLHLAPGLGGEEFTSEKYTFEWKAISKEGVETLLAETPVLDKEILLLPGNYTLIFRITEKATHIFWQQKCELQISDVTSEGWMILCEEGKDRTVRMDMYSEVSKKVILDVLKGNGMPELHGPHRISWMQGNLVDKDSPFYLTTEDGTTRLGKNGFEWKEEYSLEYEMGRQSDSRPVQINEVVNGKILCDHNTVWYSDCLVATGLFAQISPSLKAAPAVGTNLVNKNIFIPMSLLYDLENKRFMGYAPNLRDDLMGNAEPLHEMNEMVDLLENLSNAGKVVGNAFEEFPVGLDYVWMENTQYDPNKTGTGITYAVLKDEKKFYLYGIQSGELLGGVDVGGPAFAIGKAYHADLSGCQDIALADHFAFSSLTACMYYAVGGTLYRVDLSNPQQIRSERQFSLDGEKIEVLEFNLYKDPDLALKNYDLVVASNEIFNDVEGGHLRIYEGFTSEGDFKGVRPTHYKGFGHIVDVAYRELQF